TQRQRSDFCNRCSAAMARALASRFACVSTTPLGTPVVPDVYMSRAGMLASTGSLVLDGTGDSVKEGREGASGDVAMTVACAPLAAIAALTTGASSAVVKTILASEWPRMYASCFSWHSRLIGLTT